MALIQKLAPIFGVILILMVYQNCSKGGGQTDSAQQVCAAAGPPSPPPQNSLLIGQLTTWPQCITVPVGACTQLGVGFVDSSGNNISSGLGGTINIAPQPPQIFFTDSTCTVNVWTFGVFGSSSGTQSLLSYPIFVKIDSKNAIYNYTFSPNWSVGNSIPPLAVTFIAQ